MLFYSGGNLWLKFDEVNLYLLEANNIFTYFIVLFSIPSILYEFVIFEYC